MMSDMPGGSADRDNVGCIIIVVILSLACSAVVWWPLGKYVWHYWLG